MGHKKSAVLPYGHISGETARSKRIMVREGEQSYPPWPQIQICYNRVISFAGSFFRGNWEIPNRVGKLPRLSWRIDWDIFLGEYRNKQRGGRIKVAFFTPLWQNCHARRGNSFEGRFSSFLRQSAALLSSPAIFHDRLASWKSPTSGKTSPAQFP